MRPDLVAWLDARGLPGWLAPDYAIAVSLAGMFLAWSTLRVARRDGAPVQPTARALAFAYVGALGGGYVFEFFRVLPTSLPHAIAARSFVPLFNVGRAAYGGLLGGIALPWLYLRVTRQPVAAFFDRVSVGTGVTFALVRVGCFLEGCDYGLPTSGGFGVRFPAGTAAAMDHAWKGWVPVGARSLPVHPTQLYESLVGVVAAAVSSVVLARRPARDGRAFLAFLAVYAAGRFAVEYLRGDAARGVYLGFSSAQVVSIVLLAVVARLARPRGDLPARA